MSNVTTTNRQARNAGIARITQGYRDAEAAEWKARAAKEQARTQTPTTRLAVEGTLRDGLSLRITAQGADTSWVLYMLESLHPAQTTAIARQLRGYGGRRGRAEQIDSQTAIAALHGLEQGADDSEAAFSAGRAAAYGAGLGAGQAYLAANLASYMAAVEYHQNREQERLRAVTARARAEQSRIAEQRRSPLVHLLVATA